MHWKHSGGPGAFSSMLINGLGALVTGVTTRVVIVAKFTEGAWVRVLAIPGLILLMRAVHHHYEIIQRGIGRLRPAQLKGIAPPIVAVPLRRWSKVEEKAFRFAYRLSQEVLVLHVVPLDEHGAQTKDELSGIWEQYIEKPVVQAGRAAPELVVPRSPYRLVITPIVNYILELERKHQNRLISVLVPELVERR